MNICFYDNKDNPKRITLKIEVLNSIYGMLFNTAINDIGKSIRLKTSGGKYFVQLISFYNEEYNEDLHYCSSTIREISGFE